MKKQDHEAHKSRIFQKVMESSNQEGSMTYFVAKLLEDFTEEQKQETLGKVKSFTDVLDRLKNLVELAEAEGHNVKQD